MFRGFLGSFLDNMMSSHRSNIETLLDKDDTKLETLLEDSEILTQCKWGNQKLVNYFDHDKVSQLIEYIINMPPEGCSHDRGHKLPFVASEIFNCELNKINDIFFQARPQKQFQSIESLKQEKKQLKKQQYSDNDDDEEHEGNKHNNQDDDDVFQPINDNDDEFEKLISSDNQLQEDNSNDIEGSNILRKSFGEPTKKSKSNRYEVQDDEEIDQDEIELHTDETLDGQVPQHQQIEFQQDNQQDQVQNLEKAQEPQPVVDHDEDSKQIDEFTKVEGPVIQEEPVVAVQQDEEHQQNQLTSHIQENYIEEQNEPPTTATEYIEEEVKHEVEEDAQNHAILEDEINLEDDYNHEEQHLDNDDEDDNQTLSTAITRQDGQQESQEPPNEFELFEKLLSFLDSTEELNPVLTGYFCKLFQVLVGNKPKEVFGYIYANPNVLDKFINHLNDKSVSEILIRLLNVSENLFDDSEGSMLQSPEILDGIRQSYIYKIVGRLAPECSFEDNLNAQTVLSELVEYKAIYQELTSQRCLEKYEEYLTLESSVASKSNTYILLQQIASKYKQNEHFSKKINISNFQDCGDDMMLDEEEDVLVFSGDNDKESAFFAFVKKIIIEAVQKELAIPQQQEEDADLLDSYQRSYGFCKEPFGMVRIRAVEFLTQVNQIFFKDIHQTFVDADLYNSLLFYFDHYPFHNVLHMKVSEIFTLALDKNNEAVVNHLLYQTSLIKQILESSRDGGIHTFSGTGQTVNKGYMAFMRKLANKLDDLSKKNEEVQNFLESIPEWSEFHKNILTAINAIENKPLGSDPRKKDLSSSDDYFDMIYKLKDSNRSGFQNKKKSGNDNDDEEEDDEEADEQQHEEQNDVNNHNNQDDDEDEDANRNKDLYFSSELGTGKSRNKKNKAYQSNDDDGNQDDEEEEEEDSDFDRLIYRHDDDGETHNNNNDDLQQYFSNGDDQTKKPWESEDNGLSMSDLIPQELIPNQVETPKFAQEVDVPLSAQSESDINHNQAGVEIIENNTQEKANEPEVSVFHAQFYWKDALTTDNSVLDALLQDYE
eukprot:403366086